MNWHLRGIPMLAEPASFDELYELIRRYSPCEVCPGIRAIHTKLYQEREEGIEKWYQEHESTLDDYPERTPEEVDAMFSDYDNCIAKDLRDPEGLP